MIYKRFRFLFFLIFFFLFSSLILPSSILASNEFKTSYDINYIVGIDGVTNVKQVVSLTNKLEHVFATQYNITIGSTDIYDVSASDNFGELKPLIERSDNSVNIVLKFDDNVKVVGRDKTRTINLSYKTNDFATVKGRVLDVGFPLLKDMNSLDSYKININIPEKFGMATQISSENYAFSQNGSYLTYSFDAKAMDSNKGITATFGKDQLLDFVLRYSLENKYEERVRTEIALPPDTGHQKVLYDKIEPIPEKIEVDFDGNWLATYILEPNELVTVMAYGSVLISSDYNENFKENLTEDEIINLTKPDNYWESQEKQIKELAAELGSPEAIYDYVVNNFSYDYDRLDVEIDRLGAAQALANPNRAVCMEFTDTFIALSRALGIPAREHNGYALTENERLRPIFSDQDVLHSWPEYYDFGTESWVEIDPTWGNTTGGLDFFHKFDLDHFTSVIHGLESEYPITVASYKTENTEGKDIEVSFGDSFDEKESFDFSIVSPEKGKTGIMYKAVIEVINTGNTAIYDLPVDAVIERSGEKVKATQELVEVLPPFAKVEIPIEYMTSWKDKGGEFEMYVVSPEKELVREFELSQILDPRLLLGLGVGGIVFVLSMIIIVLKMRKKK